jgi:hypothetical protein
MSCGRYCPFCHSKTLCGLLSRGLGKMQNALLATVRQHGKPMTFADIRATINEGIGRADRDAKLRASFERSLRRALHRLTSDPFLIAMGDGGPGDRSAISSIH